MRAPLKAAAVVAGYVAAGLAAWGAVAVRQYFTRDAAAQASAGMHAFGDLVLLVFVFGLVATVPSALALYFLRPWQRFWTLLAPAALALCATGVLAAALLALQIWQPGVPAAWGLFAVPRLLATPVLTAAFLFAGLMAPPGRARSRILAAAWVETATGLFALACGLAASRAI